MELRRVEMLGRWGSDGRRVLVTDVPAWVCERCGEQVLDHETARSVEALVRRGADPRDDLEPVTVRHFGHSVVQPS